MPDFQPSDSQSLASVYLFSCRSLLSFIVMRFLFLYENAFLLILGLFFVIDSDWLIVDLLIVSLV